MEAMKAMLAERKVRHPSLVDHVVDGVVQAIASGTFPPGDKVTEGQLSAEIGVSRTPVREAVKRMAEMGLVVVRPRCGLEIAAIDESDLAEITQLRETLEGLALRLAAKRITPDEIACLEVLQRACERWPGEGDRQTVFRADSQFHLEIARCSGNRYLFDALRRLDVKVHLCRVLFCRSERKIRESICFHRRIITALKRKQPGLAEKLLREHVRNTIQEK